jgi:hypothetical protein
VSHYPKSEAGDSVQPVVQPQVEMRSVGNTPLNLSIENHAGVEVAIGTTQIEDPKVADVSIGVSMIAEPKN